MGGIMSGKVYGWVLDQPKLPAHLKHVLGCYASYANDEGYKIFPSIDLVAKKCGLHRRTIQRNTRKLERLGYLISVNGQTGGRGRSNRWRIPIIKGDIRATLYDLKGDIVSPFPIKKDDIQTVKRVTSAPPDPSLELKYLTPLKESTSHVEDYVDDDEPTREFSSSGSKSVKPSRAPVDPLIEALIYHCPGSSEHDVDNAATMIRGEHLGGVSDLEAWVKNTWPGIRPGVRL